MDQVAEEGVLSPKSLAQLISNERSAREKALAETAKMQEWRLVHFAEEFTQRLGNLEKHLHTANPVLCHPLVEMKRQLELSEVHSQENERLHLQNTRLTEVMQLLDETDRRLTELTEWVDVQRAGQGKDQHHPAVGCRLQECERRIFCVESRLGSVESQLAQMSSHCGRLQHVENLIGRSTLSAGAPKHMLGYRTTCVETLHVSVSLSPTRLRMASPVKFSSTLGRAHNTSPIRSDAALKGSYFNELHTLG